MAKVTIKGSAKNIAKLLGGQRTLYMHTLDGWPASFFKGEGVLFCNRITIASSLRQIRVEQDESQRIRTHKGITGKERYGYKLIVIPPSTSGAGK